MSDTESVQVSASPTTQSPLPVMPLSYHLAGTGVIDVMRPLVRTSAMLLLVWCAMDFVYYLMSLKSTLSMDPYWDDRFIWILNSALAMIACALLMIGSWHARAERRSALRLLIAGEIVWLGVLLLSLIHI